MDKGNISAVFCLVVWLVLIGPIMTAYTGSEGAGFVFGFFISCLLVWPIAWLVLYLVENAAKESEIRRRMRMDMRLTEYGQHLKGGGGSRRRASRVYEEEKARYLRELGEREKMAQARSYLYPETDRRPSHDELIDAQWEEGESDSYRANYKRSGRERRPRLPPGGWNE